MWLIIGLMTLAATVLVVLLRGTIEGRKPAPVVEGEAPAAAA
jgi:hypothetical protein